MARLSGPDARRRKAHRSTNTAICDLLRADRLRSADRDDTCLPGPARRLDVDDVADARAHERAAERRVGDTPPTGEIVTSIGSPCSSCTSTIDPGPMCSSVSCSTTTAVRRRSRSFAIRASSIPWSFFAAWYSKFSDRSPNLRAVAIASIAAARRGPSSSASSASSALLLILGEHLARVAHPEEATEAWRGLLARVPETPRSKRGMITDSARAAAAPPRCRRGSARRRLHRPPPRRTARARPVLCRPRRCEGGDRSADVLDLRPTGRRSIARYHRRERRRARRDLPAEQRERPVTAAAPRPLAGPGPSRQPGSMTRRPIPRCHRVSPTTHLDSAEQDCPAGDGVIGHRREGARTWAGVRDLGPARAVPLPRVAESRRRVDTAEQHDLPAAGVE